ncbi:MULTISPECIES: hypothetical protein [Bacillus]|uniref:hypothetical protein n=1 Tax=Bacillus TaxID=1386 RepID=UPI001364740F|nr:MULTISPECIES: hypothetical protein [Bacillus]MCX2820163.1 hypothetical protein [Bacillus sp. H1F1]QHJ03696.1 hypothetical protein GNE05_10740 [Bacillus sp. AM1(2019)]
MGKLDEYLSKTNERLLNDFTWGSQGYGEFSEFMNLVRNMRAQKEEHKNEHQHTCTWQCNDCGYAWTGDETDFDCPKCEGNDIEEIDSSI